MKTRLLIIIGISLLLPMQLVFAEPLVPEPGSVCPDGTTVKNDVCIIASTDCAEGTTYQDGICIVNKIKNSTKSSSYSWGGSPYTFDVESPLKQYKAGIPIDKIQCRNNLVLIKKHDGAPACVKPKTKTKLIERG